MTHKTFVAFSSADPLISETIVEVCRSVRSTETEYEPWSRNDVSGQPIDESVLSWVDGADSFVADISEPNHNVTYEIGLALGMAKPVRLIRAAHKDRKLLEQVGLLHNIGHNDYANKATLTEIFTQSPPVAPWPLPRRNREQPIYFVQPSVADHLFSRVASGIKKILKLRFRSFSPREVDRLTATEAFEQVAQSFGVIAVWHDTNASEHLRQNQRTAFVIGVARALEIPFLLLAEKEQRLPLDLDEVATRWSDISDVDLIMSQFREQVYEAQEEFTETRPHTQRFLELVHCGDPAAENEAATLDNYFLETEQYRLTLDGELNILLGRKGSGKTAIFLQVRDKTRANKSNIVIDLQPENFQLVKLKEFVLEQLSHGARKEFIAAFWEYIIWLEIAYKLLEKDANRVIGGPKPLNRRRPNRKRSDFIPEAYERLSRAYRQRVESTGDFSERLTALTERIVSRYEETRTGPGRELSSSKLLEVVYGSEIHDLRDEVLNYLKVKGIVFVLFDNLDRFWTPTGFVDVDSLIIIGLIESLIDIRKRVSRAEIDFYWAIFLRSDVYEFVVKGIADYGKLAVASAEWNDRELLFRMFEKRVLQGFGGVRASWREVWESVSVQKVNGKATMDFLIDASLMRPRYLIRLFETARRRAVTLGRNRIEEIDYEAALEELGWQVLEDFDRELVDIVPDSGQLIFDIAAQGSEMSLKDLRDVIMRRVSRSEIVDVVIDVLIWTGCIGARGGPRGITYISDCGFKRPFIRSLLPDSDEKSIVFHPTLAAVIAAPRSLPVALRKRSGSDAGRQIDLELKYRA